jgi:diguanylate cyclase (GGDEF)-like protein
VRTRSLRPATWLALGGLVAVLAYLLHTLGAGGRSLDDLFGRWVYTGVEVLGSGLCLWRGLAVRADRTGWLVMAGGAAAWTVGDALWTFWLDHVDNPPFPSLADAAYCVNYVACYVGLVLLLRARVRPWRLELWLDGLIGAFALSAVCAAFVFEPIRQATHGSTATVALNLAYPILDILLLGFVVVAFAVSGWRPGRQWTLLGLGLALTAVADGVFAYQEAAGTYVDGTWLDPLWPAAILAVGWAAWQRPASRGVSEIRWSAASLPIAFTLTAMGLLVAGQLDHIGVLAAGLAAAGLLVGVARACLTFAENLRLLERSRQEATTDGLSGLPNRRALMRDLEGIVEDGEPAALVFFDLDGFKLYNDTFGHAAGDALLRRLGQRLAESVGGAGTAYRLGGDEFCAILRETAGGRAPATAEAHGPATDGAHVRAAAAALSESGEGFAIGTSYGVVALPADASDATTALQLADERMYAHKSGRRAARRAALRPEPSERVGEVARLALAVAHAYGLPAEDCDVIGRAAELHDVGKLAVPDAILAKPGPLDAEELELVGQHTKAGERLLVAAPALRPVARLVRACHERWDGTGYPDGLAGEAIPLGARIIAVCEAYDAMTTDRPYRTAMPARAALVELRRCSGSQFDPEAVRVFAAVALSDRTIV